MKRILITVTEDIHQRIQENKGEHLNVSEICRQALDLKLPQIQNPDDLRRQVVLYDNGITIAIYERFDKFEKLLGIFSDVVLSEDLTKLFTNMGFAVSYEQVEV